MGGALGLVARQADKGARPWRLQSAEGQGSWILGVSVGAATKTGSTLGSTVGDGAQPEGSCSGSTDSSQG
jgi:hypothetical protein